MKKWMTSTKRKLIVIVTMFTVLLVGCYTDSKEIPLADIYSTAFDALMEEDKSLNDNMAYIAIDLSTFEDLNETAKLEILDYFANEYDIDVMDATFEMLREKGYFNEEALALDGVLLRKEKVDISNTKVVFTGSKYRSGKGAIGMEVTLRKKGGEWVVTKSKLNWIASNKPVRRWNATVSQALNV